MRAIEILEKYPRKPFKSREGYFRSNRKILSKHQPFLFKAQFDQARNCIFCGEAGECPGWHLPEEIAVNLTRLSYPPTKEVKP